MSSFAFVVLSCVFSHQTSAQLTVYSSSSLNDVIGNFSMELLYHTGKSQTGNIVVSPFMVWSVLAAVAEGALKSTRQELTRALRISTASTLIRATCQRILLELALDSTTGHLTRVSTIYIHEHQQLESDYRQISQAYDTNTIPVNFMDAGVTSNAINRAVSIVTKGLISNLVHENDFSDPEMIITSAAYFKGQWTAAFDPLSTSNRPFYDINGVQTGEVNMMYNRFAYPFLEINELKASVVELPYGLEEQLSLLVILPNQNISLTDIYINFAKLRLETVFSKLRLYKQEHGNDKIDCYIPRFKIESDLELKEVLEKGLGISKLFHKKAANLGRMSRGVVYATKLIHKAIIEVSEEGNAWTTAQEVTNTEDVPKFEANRPFTYFVLEKNTNTVLLAGVYQRPLLY